ncbi:hypothetical protein, unlikely [Trypanosoma brucei gambiense DAL972]|uniref:Uncharacterized protein n=1 Tax=Trypanosoma brucei gambiense (strain MHOM/CI/86/DAL972) TaxID=679716 RepID=D0A180_TRYB9|nr:hypothetical protein, unlikely [Trypanosoma brucei gambiense DAL972]CBH15022.1 hypothetical protein, unlikely [Trypanosoma brucei gambiense DAL972]|eukprot:XP_011777288.1 hypothetical protein, unlikely [Trypanosoma brucei gambiense DAL972]
MFLLLLSVCYVFFFFSFFCWGFFDCHSLHSPSPSGAWNEGGDDIQPNTRGGRGGLFFFSWFVRLRVGASSPMFCAVFPFQSTGRGRRKKEGYHICCITKWRRERKSGGEIE